MTRRSRWNEKVGYSVYYLIDPKTNVIRYVGYSKYPAWRYKGHLRDSKDVRKRDWDSRKCYWIRSLLEVGLKLILQVVCVVETHEEVQRIEVALIERLRQRDVPLTNGTIGGDGGSQGPEARLKMKLAKLGKKQNLEHVDKRRVNHHIGALRRFEDQEQREKQAEITRAQWADPIARAKKIEGLLRFNRMSVAEKLKIAQEKVAHYERLMKSDGIKPNK